MDEKDDDIAHWAIVARTANARKCSSENHKLAIRQAQVSLQDDDLVAECEDFQLQRRARSERESNGSEH